VYKIGVIFSRVKKVTPVIYTFQLSYYFTFHRVEEIIKALTFNLNSLNIYSKVCFFQVKVTCKIFISFWLRSQSQRPCAACITHQRIMVAIHAVNASKRKRKRVYVFNKQTRNRLDIR